MLNNTVLVGRLVSDPKIKETENGKKVSNITLAVQRPYKNSNGKYDTDFIDCTLWDSIAKSTCDCCKKGDLIGVKGRISTSKYEKDGKTQYKTDIIAEKITFLSTKDKAKEQEEPSLV